MKATLQAYLRTRDFERLEASFVTLSLHAPTGYVGWEQAARAGAAASAAGDEVAVRSSCQECHEQHRSRFRRERRGVALF